MPKGKPWAPNPYFDTIQPVSLCLMCCQTCVSLTPLGCLKDFESSIFLEHVYWQRGRSRFLLFGVCSRLASCSPNPNYYHLLSTVLKTLSKVIQPSTSHAVERNSHEYFPGRPLSILIKNSTKLISVNNNTNSPGLVAALQWPSSPSQWRPAVARVATGRAGVNHSRPHTHTDTHREPSRPKTQGW